MKENLKQILKSNFGHSDFRLNQYEIIESVLNKQDTLAIMPTGGGKSVCYQVPALYLDGVTLVVSPLISLMQDQVIGLEQNGIKSCYLNSTLSSKERSDVEERIKSGEVKLLYLSPEGLMSSRTQLFLKNISLSLVAIDEAHCVSQWGHEFRNDYRRLGELKALFPNIPTLALTATADEKTRTDIAYQLKMKEPQIFISSFDRPNICYYITEKSDEVKQLHEFLSKNHEGDTGIVYCLSRKKVEKVTLELRKRGYDAYAYHAGLGIKARESAQKKFNTQDNVIIVATIAFGMGIDRPDVRFVAHLDLPKSIEGYYQETGRAGRDGKESNVWMAYGLQDLIKLSQMIETTEASTSYKQLAKLKLDSMLYLCETGECRRNYLLRYFGEIRETPCGNCDTCLNPVELVDATTDAQKVLSAVFRTEQFYGTNHIIEILRGSKSAKILERSQDKLSVYGIGKERSKSYWSAVIRQLLNHDYLRIKNWDYRNLGLTEKSGEILKGKTIFKIRKIEDKSSVGKISKTNAKLINESHGRLDLFESLRSLRTKLAEEGKVPPYVIFSDKSLHDMCQILPRNESEFLMVNGVGESKCSKYSKSFLEVIKNSLM